VDDCTDSGTKNVRLSVPVKSRFADLPLSSMYSNGVVLRQRGNFKFLNCTAHKCLLIDNSNRHFL